MRRVYIRDWALTPEAWTRDAVDSMRAKMEALTWEGCNLWWVLNE